MAFYLFDSYQSKRKKLAKTMRKQNPDGVVVVYTKIEPAEKVNSSEELAPVRAEVPVQFRFNKPKHESVIPAKRRSVKRMMFDEFVQSIVHLFRPRNKANTNSSSFNKTKTKKP